MALETTFETIALDDLVHTAEKLRNDGWRCVQMLCVNTDDGVDLTYSFSNEAMLANYQVRGVGKDLAVPSIQNLFPAVFPFENEAVDLFGVNIKGMLLDFAGQFYQVSTREPMTIITPEAKQRREKAAKAAQAKAAKQAKGAASDEAEAKPTAKTKEDIEAKMASMDPEKAAKLKAALEAKAKREQSGKEGA